MLNIHEFDKVFYISGRTLSFCKNKIKCKSIYKLNRANVKYKDINFNIFARLLRIYLHTLDTKYRIDANLV